MTMNGANAKKNHDDQNLLINSNDNDDDGDDVNESFHLLGESGDLTSSKNFKLTSSPTNNNKYSNKIKFVYNTNQKKSHGIVRNKRFNEHIHNSQSDAHNISGNILHATKIKPLFAFIIVALLLVVYISSLQTWDTVEKIPVIHESHVPGKKELTNYDDRNILVNLSSKLFSAKQIMTTAKIVKLNESSVITNASNIKAKPTSTTTILSISSSSNNSSIIKILSTTVTNDHFNYINSTIHENSSTTYYYSSYPPANTTISTTNVLSTTPPKGYLVWSNQCKMLNIDTYAFDTMKYFKREKYEACTKEEPLTTVEFNTTLMKYVININETLRLQLGNSIYCGYQEIIRNFTDKKTDRYVSLSERIRIKNSSQIIPNEIDNILVKCRDDNKNQAYINGHSMMPERSEIRKRLNAWKANDTERPVSILMLGIDSISRVNLLRAMPKTAQELYDNEWFELSGYNKMDDNTFPNLMAILTGFNSTTAYRICDPKKLHKLDECPMIWKLFRDHGYVTAYAEDETEISTFNYLKVGFQKLPTDYYLRPFLISAENNLPIKRKSGLKFCLGYQHSADYVFDYALELSKRYLKDAFFGLFWTNTFSHNDISDSSSMDKKVYEYIRKLGNTGVLNETVVFFFSDHGMRFGPTRKTLSGHLEERLPMMFIWLPQWFKNRYPDLVNGLANNKNHLTNPYDIHMTLKNLLEISGRTGDKKLEKASDCPNCMTILKEVPHNRSCEEISIEDHWCTCIPYKMISTKQPIIDNIANFVVDYINDFVQNFQNGSFSNLCGKIKLYGITDAFHSNITLNENSNIAKSEVYRLVIKTTPGSGLFEATVRHYLASDKLEVTGSISRLNSYASDSKCVSDGAAKKYCHCLKHPIKSNVSPKKSKT